MNEKVLEGARDLISGFFKSRREELGITQLELAEASGMGIATIKRFESGKFWINMKQYLILCHYLKLYPFVEEVESDKPLAKAMRERWKRDGDNN